MADFPVNTFSEGQPNAWLGIPRTAVNVVPVTAGLPLGQVPLEDVGLNGTSYPRSKKRLHSAHLHNRSGGVASVAVVGMYPDKAWIAGSWVEATTTFADDTTDAQDAGAGDFPLFTLTVNDGFIVGCRYPFNVLSIDQSTASGGSPVVDYAYWGAALNGSATTGDWRAITNPFSIVFDPAAAAAERLVMLAHPLSLMIATTTTTDITGAPIGYYYIRIRATTAPTTTAGTAARIYVGRLIRPTEAVADNGTQTYETGGDIVMPGGIVALHGAFSVAGQGNYVTIEYA